MEHATTQLDSPGARLAAWLARHGRALPWRQDRSPYRVWVSEVMLQQTRAGTVAPYFLRFVAAFPDVRALAGASLEAVLKQWEGLGYYRRAHHLHRAAAIVVDEHGGMLPDTEAGLRALPGLGPYSAAAVAALAFGRPAVAVDANVRRVGCRVLGLGAPDDAAIQAAFGAWIGAAPEPWRVTEALIELGALVCTPRRPACDACPLRSACRAAASGAPEAYPARARRRPPPLRTRYALVRADARGVWLAQRPPGGLLGGMWGFPQRDARPPGEPLGTVTHAYSHFRLELVVVAVNGGSHGGGREAGADPGAPVAQHVAWGRLPSLPISKVDAEVLELLAASRTVRRAPDAADGCDTMPP